MNIKFITFFVCLFIVSYCNSQSNIGIINDPDGYVNIRLEKSNKSEIIGVLKTNEYFSYFPNKESNWWVIENEKGMIGYVHKSRIKFSQKGYLHNGKLVGESVLLSINEHKFRDFLVEIIQFKPVDTFYSFDCKAKVRVLKNKKVFKELKFQEIDALGDNHGIVAPTKQPSNSLFVLSKFGDYNGQIIIINLEGKITTFNGGSYFLTNNNRYLISDWHSDTSGLSIYDLKNEKLVFEEELEEHLGNWYVKKDIYYVSIWNDNEEVNKAYQIDFDNYKLIESNMKKEEGQKVELFNTECSCN
ncbi:SH3 domain-containing protein [Tenacibaculum sp. MEBiC06402]|uniref:SH3 domain-containing protein n=1 Tax=unclassified Tenacibaculum TaxID=2635139 RepID=UPI003B9DA592